MFSPSRWGPGRLLELERYPGHVLELQQGDDRDLKVSPVPHAVDQLAVEEPLVRVIVQARVEDPSEALDPLQLLDLLLRVPQLIRVPEPFQGLDHLLIPTRDRELLDLRGVEHSRILGTERLLAEVRHPHRAPLLGLAHDHDQVSADHVCNLLVLVVLQARDHLCVEHPHLVS